MNPKIRETLLRAVPYLKPDVAEAVVSLLVDGTSGGQGRLRHSLNDDMITVETRYVFNDLLEDNQPMALMAAGCLAHLIDEHERQKSTNP